MIALAVAGAALTACNNDPSTTTDGETPSTSSSTTIDEPTTDGTTVDPTDGTTVDPTDGTTVAPTDGTTVDPTDGTTVDPTEGTTVDPTEGVELPARVEALVKAFTAAHYECPERIWPDVAANYQARQVLLASEAENRAWIWNYQDGDGEPPRVHEIALDTLGPEWARFYNVGEIDGVKTLGLSLDITDEYNDPSNPLYWPDYALVVGFHEGFHFLSDQTDWTASEGDRAAPYPEPWEPRYLRAELKRSLLADVLGTPSLGAAAHWLARLHTEHPEEVQKMAGVDIREGSAEYVSLMMSALSELGCAATDAEVLDLALFHLEDGTFLYNDNFVKSRESYDFGVLGGLLLRRDAVPGWELKAEQGEPPVDQVLADVAPDVQAEDADLLAAVQGAVEARNMFAGAEIEPLVAAMQDPAYTRIVFDGNWISGTWYTNGFFYLAQDPNQSDVRLTFSASMKTPAGVSIEFTKFTVLTDIETPCALSGEDTIVVAVPTAELTVAGDVGSFNSEKLLFTELAVESTSDSNNLPWLCPIEAGGTKNGAPAPKPDVKLKDRSAGAHTQGVELPLLKARAAR